MSAPVAVDLFACEGAFGAGLARAGWDVRAVELDRNHYRRNPYGWLCGDWRDGLNRALDELQPALLHASPPCQGKSSLRELARAQGRGAGRSAGSELIGPVVEALEATGLPYTVENVPRSGLRPDLVLCGSSFGLAVQRHRIFRVGGGLVLPPSPPCAHHLFPADPVTGRPRPWGVYGSWRDDIPSGGRTARDGAHARRLLGLDELHPMTDRAVREALPPAYGEWVGTHALAALAVAA